MRIDCIDSILTNAYRHWQFGPDVRVLELTAVGDWTNRQRQEFELRMGGYVQWAGVMAEPNWLDRNLWGWHYGYNFLSDARAIPFVVLVDDSALSDVLPESVMRHIRQHSRFLPWSTAQDHFASELKTLVVRYAREKELQRVQNKARESCELQQRVGCNERVVEAEWRGFTRGSNLEKKKREANRHQDLVVQVPIEVPIDGHFDRFCALIQCPISQDVMVDPLLNFRSGQSYSAELIRKWCVNTAPILSQERRRIWMISFPIGTSETWWSL